MLAGLAAAAALTAWVAIAGAPLPGDVRVTRAVQDLPAPGWAADTVNLFGTDLQWLVVIPSAGLAALRARRSSSAAVRRAAMTALAALVVAAALSPGSTLLKEVARSPRPEARYGVSVDRLRDSYGFPSGHVYSDVLLYGTLAVHAAGIAGRRAETPARAAAAAIILLSGPARIVVGAHWPSDVVGGYLWGFVALWGALRAGDVMSRH